MDHVSPPPLLVVATALTGIVTALLLWFWLVGWGLSPRSISGAIDAARAHPLVLLWALHHVLLLATAAVWALRDAAARGLGLPARLTWLLLIALLGVIGVWAYLARRMTPQQHPPAG